MAVERSFPEEIYHRGEPDLRPEEGHIVLSRTRGMDALEARYRGRALLATVEYPRPPVSPGVMMAALESQCGVQRARVRVEVTFPADFFIQFESEEDCTRVVRQSRRLRCAGTTVHFRRWSRFYGAMESKIEYYCKISVEGLPASGWDAELVSELVTMLDGKLVTIEPRGDRWLINCFAWMKNPCGVPKKLRVEIPEPLPPPRELEEGESPPPPFERRFWRSLMYPVLVHVEKVLDRSPIITAGFALSDSSDDEDRDFTRTHRFPVWGGRVDGTGPGNPHGGGHPYAGPGIGIARGLAWDGAV